MMRLVLFPLILLTLAACSKSSTGTGKTDLEPSGFDTLVYLSEVDADSVEFIILKMNRAESHLELVDSVIPAINDSTIGLCVEAAFTGDLLSEFTSSNIAGDYVMNGTLRKGYDCDANTGLLYADMDTVVIAPLSEREKWTERAVKSGGTLFEQMMILHNGANVYKGTPIRPVIMNIYRSACVMNDGNFAVIQSRSDISLGDFISSLIEFGVRDALYLDMGEGWNYGWYRLTMDSTPVLLFEDRTPFQTNWLIIRSNSW